MNKVEQSGGDSRLLDAIHENATRALAAAESMRQSGHGPYALHFAIICWEECSKYLLAYCKDHLPEKQFKSRYNHVSKYSLAMGIHYLSGSFSVVHLLQELHDSDAWEEGRGGLAVVTEALLQKIGFGNPEHLARSLMDSLSSEKDEKQVEAAKKHFEEAERLRTQSVCRFQ